MPLGELDEEKHFKFTCYEPGNGAECLDYTTIYTSSGKNLAEAKSKLIREQGCSHDYFDDVDYVKIEEIPNG